MLTQEAIIVINTDLDSLAGYVVAVGPNQFKAVFVLSGEETFFESKEKALDWLINDI